MYDSVGGIDWSRGDAGYGGYGADVASDGYPRLPYPTRDADGGLGGAAIGAVVGGVAGNVIAGSGNRLGGTLLGAGAGALAGMAIDKADRAGRVPVAPPPGAGYPPPGAGYPPPPGAAPGAPGALVSHFAAEAGTLPVPLMIVPGGLDAAAIDRLS